MTAAQSMPGIENEDVFLRGASPRATRQSRSRHAYEGLSGNEIASSRTPRNDELGLPRPVDTVRIAQDERSEVLGSLPPSTQGTAEALYHSLSRPGTRRKRRPVIPGVPPGLFSVVRYADWERRGASDFRVLASSEAAMRAFSSSSRPAADCRP